MAPKLLIFSWPNSLSIKLAQGMISKGLDVYLVGTKNDGKIPKLNFLDIHDNIPFQVDYVILVQGFGEEHKNQKANWFTIKKNPQLLDYALKYIQRTNARVTVILPANGLESLPETLREQLILKMSEDRNIKTVVLGNLFGPGVKLQVNIFQKVIWKAFSTNKIPILPDELHLIYEPDAVDELTRIIFSYNPFGIFALYKKYSGAEITSRLKIFLPSLTQTSEYEGDLCKPKLGPYPPRHTSPDALIQTLRSFSVIPKVNIIKPKNNVSKKPKSKMALPVFLLIIIFLWLAISPFVTWAVSAASLAFSFKQFKNGNYSLGFVGVKSANILALISKNEFYLLSNTPIASSVYNRFFEQAHILSELSTIAKQGGDSLKLAMDVGKNFIINKNFDVKTFSKELSLNLESLSSNLGFLQAELVGLPRLQNTILSNFDLTQIKKYAQAGSDFTQTLPDLLGVNRRMTYMLMFQNNSELRPTGGFIGSFGLLTLDGGKIVDISVMDVYAADGQLRGHVEPPAPIKNYLGEASWYLRDSNWDPDFSVSAPRAEWFLQKEVDRSIDGVIAVDLEVVKKFLQITGPVKVDGFVDEITSKNMYEKLQFEVQENFFPGSYQKANILTGLSRAIMNRLTNLKDEDFQKIALSFFNLAKARHVQLFFNDQKLQNAVSEMGFEGGFTTPDCIGKCQSIFASLIDANVGVNKANFFIQKSFSLDVSINNSKVFHTLKVRLNNTSRDNNALGGRYKSYLRAIAHSNAVFDSVLLSGGKTDINFDPEIVSEHGLKSGGVMVEVPAGQRREVSFRWSEQFDPNASILNLFFRKQAGTGADPIQITINWPILTNTHTVSYNTTLDRDFESLIPLN